jgi:hypothetical protein
MTDFDIFGWDRTEAISWVEAHSACRHEQIVRGFRASDGHETWFCEECAREFSPRPVTFWNTSEPLP